MEYERFEKFFRGKGDMQNRIKELETENEALCRTLTLAEDKINELKQENKRLRRSLVMFARPG